MNTRIPLNKHMNSAQLYKKQLTKHFQVKNELVSKIIANLILLVGNMYLFKKHFQIHNFTEIFTSAQKFKCNATKTTNKLKFT